MAEPRVRVILNPMAASGSALHRVGELEQTLRRFELEHEIVLTRARGHAAELARAAAQDGVDVIAVMGGDGTMNEVVQAYVSPQGEALPGPDLALIPCGTGADLRRTFGLSGALDEAVGRIRHGARRRVDLGVVHLVSHLGVEAAHPFVNVASIGLAGQVDAVVNEGRKGVTGRLGRAAFFAGMLRAMAEYTNAAVRLKVDGAEWYEGPIVNLTIANGRFFGGGIMVAPHADPCDGRFEIILVGDLSHRELLGLAPKMYRGAHLATRGVRVTSGTRVEAEAVHPWATVLVDADGEQPGRLPIRVSLANGALTFRV
jgi:diacylglycerol kinase (ATP)